MSSARQFYRNFTGSSSRNLTEKSFTSSTGNCHMPSCKNCCPKKLPFCMSYAGYLYKRFTGNPRWSSNENSSTSSIGNSCRSCTGNSCKISPRNACMSPAGHFQRTFTENSCRSSTGYVLYTRVSMANPILWDSNREFLYEFHREIL